jgi:cysteine desulfurase
VRRIYLDHNATCPVDPRVLEAMLPFLGPRPTNPSSLHLEGRAARRAVEDARDQVAALLQVPSREIVFVSGATEANGLALRGLFAARAPKGMGRLAVSAVEHPSVLAVAQDLERCGAELVLLPVDGMGRLVLGALDEVLEQGVDLVACMAANNEVGTIQPWDEVAARCREAGVPLHVDAVQVVGKRCFTLPDPGQGTVSLSGHKFGGPQGAGALWVRTETSIRAQQVGGGQERGRRAGTENVAAIVGLGQACAIAHAEAADRERALREAEDLFWTALAAGRKDAVLHGPTNPAHRLAGTLCFRLPGVHGEALMLAMDLAGVALSVGSACSSGAAQPSHVLNAMGITRGHNLESVRVSLGWNHDRADLRRAAETFVEVAERKSM